MRSHLRAASLRMSVSSSTAVALLGRSIFLSLSLFKQIETILLFNRNRYWNVGVNKKGNFLNFFTVCASHHLDSGGFETRASFLAIKTSRDSGIFEVSVALRRRRKNTRSTKFRQKRLARDKMKGRDSLQPISISVWFGALESAFVGEGRGQTQDRRIHGLYPPSAIELS